MHLLPMPSKGNFSRSSSSLVCNAQGPQMLNFLFLQTMEAGQQTSCCHSLLPCLHSGPLRAKSKSHSLFGWKWTILSWGIQSLFSSRMFNRLRSCIVSPKTAGLPRQSKQQMTVQPNFKFNLDFCGWGTSKAENPGIDWMTLCLITKVFRMLGNLGE